MKWWIIIIILAGILTIIGMTALARTGRMNEMEQGLMNEMEKRLIMSEDYGTEGTGSNITKVTNATFTPSSKDVDLGNGKHSLTLYSGIKYIYEDDIWKEIESARSLKGSYNINYLEIDNRYNIEIEDFNYTSIELCLNVSSSELNKQIPFKRCREDINNSAKSKDNTIKECQEIKVVFMNISNKCYILSIFPMEWTYILGSNSTQLNLQNETTDNLADVEFGDSLANGYDYGFQIMWNITQLPAGQTITNSSLCVNNYVFDNSSGLLDKDVTLSRVLDYNWTETATAARINGQSLADTYTSNFWGFSTGSATWHCTNVTTIVANAYSSGFQNVSIRATDPDSPIGTVADVGDLTTLGFGHFNTPLHYINYLSRDYTTQVSRRPVLNITYEIESGADTCTYGGSGNWLITDNCDLEPTDLQGNYLFCTGNVKVTGLGNVKDYGMIFQNNGCVTVE